MKCPNCDVTLVIADRQGIEIDYCPQCRGVWLDRGELDKIIERSAQYTMRPDAQPGGYKQEPYKGDQYKGDQYKGDHYKQEHKYYPDQKHYHDPHYKHHKKKGFLSDFFDFD